VSTLADRPTGFLEPSRSRLIQFPLVPAKAGIQIQPERSVGFT